MSVILASLSPFVVSLLTQLVKKVQTIQLSPQRKKVIRLLVALFSVLAAVGTAVLTGGDIPAEQLEIFANALINFVGSLSIYHFGKSSG